MTSRARTPGAAGGHPYALGRATNRREFLAGSFTSAASLSLLAAGCGGDGGSSTSTALTKPATTPDRLSVRVYGGIFEKAFEQSAARTFTEETGIELVFDRTPDSESFTQIQTAIRSGAEPPVDVSWNTSTNGYLSMKQNLLAPLDPAIVTNLKRLNKAIAQPPDGSWGYAGAYGYSVPINFRSDLVDGTKLRSWNALWDPEFKDTIALCDIIICHIGMVAKLVGVELSGDPDMTPVFNKYRELRPNLASVTTPEQQVQSFKSGDSPLLVTLAASGREAEAAGIDVDYAAPTEGIPVDRDCFWVQSNIPEARAYYGQVLINHVLDPANQAILAGELGVTPVNVDTKLPSYQLENPRLYPFTEDEVERYAIITPTDVLAAHQTEWQTEFEKAVKG